MSIEVSMPAAALRVSVLFKVVARVCYYLPYVGTANICYNLGSHHHQKVTQSIFTLGVLSSKHTAGFAI
jgi:hypothetical protein